MTNTPPLLTNSSPHGGGGGGGGMPIHVSSTSTSAIPTSMSMSMSMSAAGDCADQAIACSTGNTAGHTQEAASCIDNSGTCKQQSNHNNNYEKKRKNRPQLASSSAQLLVHESTPSSARILASPKDKDWLSPHLCLLRQSIEAFAATPHDIEARRKQGGTTRNPPKAGYVGKAGR